MKLQTALFTLVLGAACSNRPLGLSTEGGEGGGGSGATGATSMGPGPGPGGPESGPSQTTAVADSGTGGQQSTDEGADFLPRPDVEYPEYECDLEAQDCQAGDKCVPIGVSSWWDGTACVPVVDDPQGIGDPCQLEDPATGVDDCGWAQYCWQVDEMGVGECIGLCFLEEGADPYEYSCEDPEAEPTIGCQDCFCLCIAQCDPLQRDCSEGQGCYPVGDGWQCVPDASMGAGQDAPCEFINGCSPGHACIGENAVPTCEGGGGGCCTAICDTSAPDTCPGQELGMSCLPWWEEGAAPPGFETVGVCAWAE